MAEKRFLRLEGEAPGAHSACVFWREESRQCHGHGERWEMRNGRNSQIKVEIKKGIMGTATRTSSENQR